jgi:sugar O-acyltransferase (sialic acid O-acetyltransferase NeuD family)
VSDKKIILAGYSGHGYVVIDAAIKSGLKVRYYTDLVENPNNFFNLNYLGSEADNFDYWNENISFILGVGSNEIRKKMNDLILSHNKEILNIVHPSVDFSEFFTMGIGNFLAKNVSVTPLVTLGNGNIINTGSLIDHECKIGNFVHIGPGAILAGGVKIGDCSFIGANAIIREEIKIGRNVIIGAGSVVLEDLPDHVTAVGNPAKIIKR